MVFFITMSLNAQVSILTYRTHFKPLNYEKPVNMSDDLYKLSQSNAKFNYSTINVYWTKDSLVIMRDSVIINNTYYNQSSPVNIVTVADRNAGTITSININAKYASEVKTVDMQIWKATGEVTKIGNFNAEKFILDEAGENSFAWITSDLAMDAGPVRNQNFKGVILYLESSTSISELKGVVRSKTKNIPLIEPANDYLSWDEFLSKGRELMGPVIRNKK